MTQSRQPAGVSTGGQFTPDARGRSGVSLDGASVGVDVGASTGADAAYTVPVDVDQGIRAEAADMPYVLGTRYVEARRREMSARLEADSIRAICGMAPLDGVIPTRDETGPSTPLPVTDSEPDAEGFTMSIAEMEAAEMPVPVNHPQFQRGGVTPSLLATGDGTKYRRLDENTRAVQPYSFLFVADREMSEEEIGRFAQLAGYAYRATVHGESMDDPERVSPYAFTIYADTTKGRGYADDFVQALPDVVAEGSPVRKTNRSGPGTMNTRLVDGMGKDGPSFTVYADDANTL